MIYLLLAIAANTGMSFVMRYSESHSGNRYGVTVFNYLTGVLVSLLLLKDKTLFISGGQGWFTVLFAVVNAVLFVGCLIAIQYNISKNGVGLTTTFNRLGILIPTILSALFFGEIPAALQIAGLGLAVFAIVFINKESSADAEQARLRTALLLPFLLGGSVDMASKLYGHFGNSDYQELFILYTFAFSLILSIGICLWKNPRITRQDMVSGVLVGIPNQLSALFLLKAVALLPAYLVFPVYSAAVILAVNVLNLLVFREKLSKHQAVGTGIIALALVLINM